ncbi:MAG TPA: ATP synthase F0 subunit C [Fimbriimonas sp.]|nr:ATP synthase F0 subunit C [Fimbriimonas sp.]
MDTSLIAVGAGIAVGFAVLGAGIGQGICASGALNGMARQPEALGRLQTVMIIGLAFIESLVIFALLIAFILNGHIK